MKIFMKKIISLFLALIMIAGNVAAGVSGLSEFDAKAASEYLLSVETKFYRYLEDNGTWIETRRVMPGENVRARVFVGTNYYAGPSNFMFFYNKEAFEDGRTSATKFDLNANNNYDFSYEALAVKQDSSNPVIQRMVDSGLLARDYVENSYAYIVSFDYVDNYSHILSEDKWLLEFDLTVKSDFSGEASFDVLPETLLSPNNTLGKIDVPVDEMGGTYVDCVSLYNLEVAASFTSGFVTTESNITYMTDGGLINGYEESYVQTATIGAPLVEYYNQIYVSNEYDRYGYDFDGWYDYESGYPISEFENVPYEDMTFYAQWIPHEYDLIFNAAGGSFSSGSSVLRSSCFYGEMIPEPEIPEKEGMVFVGWVTDSGEEAPDVMPYHELVLVAKWEPRYFPIVFDAGSGAFDDGSSTYFEEVIYGGKITPPEEPSRAGFKFAGWSPAIPQTMPADSVLLEAIWVTDIPETYSVFFEFEGNIPEGFAAPANVEYTAGEDVQLPVIDEVDGYIFEGWYFDGILVESFTMPNNDVKITGKWDYSEFTVTYELINAPAGVEAPEPTVEKVGTTVVIPSSPAVEGYTFDGWYYDGFLVSELVMPQKNITIIGSLNVNQYTIEFDVEGATYIEPITADYGAVIDTYIPEPEKYGYVFVGWMSDEGEFVEIPRTMPAYNMILRAVWENCEYNLTFDAGEGSFSGNYSGESLIENIPVAFGENIYDIFLSEAGGEPVREGYTFNCWLDENGAEFDINSESMPAEDLRLSASWSVNNYVLTVNADSGAFNDGTNEKTVDVPFETDINYYISTDLGGSPVKDGYMLWGWEDEEGNRYEYGDHIVMPAKNYKITAIWQAAEFKLTLDANGGRFSDGTEKKTFAYLCDSKIDNYEVFGENPTQDGYEFSGWDRILDIMPPNDVTVIAVWTEKTYEVTYSYIGSVPENVFAPEVSEYKAGDTVSLPEVPLIDGFVFNGWYYNGEIVTSFVMPSDNVEIIGVWSEEEPDTYEVMYMFTGDVPAEAAVPLSKIYVEGETVTAAAIPSFEGYTFDGWYFNENIVSSFEMPSENVILIGSWSRNKHDIILYADGGEFADGTEVFIETVAYGENISSIVPANPIKDYYEFEGWKNADGVFRDIPYTMPDADIELTAVWEKKTFEGGTLSFRTEFYRYDENYGEWVVTETVMPGESVKARLFIDTDYAAGNGDVILFYDNSFFTPDLSNSALVNNNGIYKLAVNTDSESSAAKIQADGEFRLTNRDGNIVDWLIQDGYISEDFAYEHDAIAFVFRNGSETCARLSGEQWFAEFDFFVNEDASGSGDFFVDLNTVMNPEDGAYAYVNIEVGADGADVRYADPMYIAFVDTYSESRPVTTQNEITFDASEGYFRTDNGETVSRLPVEGTVGGVVDAPIPLKDGYVFVGWSDVEGGTEDNIVDSSYLVIPHERVTYYAVWESADIDAEYKVTFYLAQGADAYYTENVIFNEPIPVPEPPEKEGMTFIGWADEESNIYSEPIFMPDNDLELYAVWELNTYSLIYYIDGAVYQEYSLHMGDAVPVPDAPQKPGYQFVGWSPDAPDFMPSHNLELYAVWKPVEYSITYVVDNKEFTDVYYFGEKIKEPVYDGYEIIGWTNENGQNAEIPEKMPANNLIFTAKFNFVSKADGFDVTAKFSGLCFNQKVKVTVEDITDKKVTSGNSGSGNINYAEKMPDGSWADPAGFYNIKMIDSSGQVSQPQNGETVTIIMKIPDKYTNRKNFMIHHWFTTGGREVLTTQASQIRREGNYLVFTVSKFSEFILYASSDAQIINAPSSAIYKGGLDLSGMQLKITNADGSVETVTDTSKMQIIGFDSSEIGKQTVTVEYEGHYAEFEVNVSYAWWQWIIRILLLGFIWY